MADPVVDAMLLGVGEQPVDPVVQNMLGGLELPGTPEQVTDEGGLGFAAIGEAITGAERITPRIEAAPEIGALRGTGQDLQIATGLLLSATPEQQMQIISEVVPDATFEQEGDVTFVMVGDEEFVLNKPGLSQQDVLQTTAQILAFTPAARLRGFVARFLAGGGTSAALDIGAEQLGAEPAPVETGIRAGIAGTLEAAAPPALRAAGRGARRVLTRQPPAGAVPESAARVEEALAAERAVGEETLLPAQRAAIPEEIDFQSFVAMLPGGSQKATKALERQNKVAAEATQELLTRVAPETAVETGQARIRSAAKKTIENAKLIRSQKASPLFNDAFDEGLEINTRGLPIPLDEFPKGGEIHSTLTRVQRLIKNAGSDLKRLHNVKTEIDQLITKTGEGGLGPTTKRQLVQVQDQLVRTLENQSPAYAEARRVFREASPAVRELEDSILGKVARFDDTQLKNISQRILDPAEVNPQVVLNARKAIRAVDPDAWDQIVRVEMERLLGGVREATTAGIQNEPSQIARALFGSRKQRRIILNALGPENAGQAQLFETWLRRASLGRPAGSQTAARFEQLKRLGGPAFALRDWFRRPVDKLADLGEDAALRAKTETVATLMFDPSFKGDLKAIQKLGNEEAAARMAKLLDGIVTGTTAFTTAEAR